MHFQSHINAEAEGCCFCLEVDFTIGVVLCHSFLFYLLLEMHPSPFPWHFTPAFLHFCFTTLLCVLYNHYTGCKQSHGEVNWLVTQEVYE